MTFDSHQDTSHLYFITAALCGWKQLFTERVYANIVLNSLAWLRHEDRMVLYAFVIMPSHLHAIVKPKDRTIGELLQNFESFTAHAILKKLRQENKVNLIQFFHEQRRDARHQHSIWQDIQAKNVYSQDFLRQKLEYIHNNPVDKDWQLVQDRADYRFSSACFYDCGTDPVIEIDDVRVWL